MENYRSTFPLPPEEIRKERLRAFLTSRLVWIPFAVLAVAGILLDLPAWALVPLLVLAFFVLALIWQARSRRLLGMITERIVRKSNTGQDAALVARIRGFAESNDDGYAVTLGKFLEAKQAIEARLHGDGKPTSASGEEIEKLVDAISIGAADEFDAVTALEKQIRALDPGRRADLQLLRARQKEHLTRVIEAYKTVKAARSELDVIVAAARSEAASAHASDPAANDLDASIARLKEETRIAVEGRFRATRDLS